MRESTDISYVDPKEHHCCYRSMLVVVENIGEFIEDLYFRRRSTDAARIVARTSSIRTTVNDSGAYQA